MITGHALYLWGDHPRHHYQPPRCPQSYDHWSLDRVSPGKSGRQQGRDWRCHTLQWRRQRTESLQPAPSVRISSAWKRGVCGVISNITYLPTLTEVSYRIYCKYYKSCDWISIIVYSTAEEWTFMQDIWLFWFNG